MSIAWRLIACTSLLMAVVSLLAVAGTPVQASPQYAGSLTLRADAASPHLVGSPVRWTVSGGARGSVYRFSVAQKQAGPYQIVRDFSTSASFSMAPLVEGNYYVRAAIAAGYGAATSRTVSGEISFAPRSAGTNGAVVPTSNPSVALFTTPACSRGQVKVGFAHYYSSDFEYTGSQNCSGQRLNFLVAGMLPNQYYQLKYFTTQRGTTTSSASVLYLTPAFARTFVSGSGPGSGMIVHMMAGSADPAAQDPIGTLTNGAEVWYLNEADLTNVWPV